MLNILPVLNILSILNILFILNILSVLNLIFIAGRYPDVLKDNDCDSVLTWSKNRLESVAP